MAGSVLHTLIEVSEHFQDVMRLAAADGILDSWGIEVVLQDVALNLREDDNFHGNLLFGLHSLLLLLARKLADLGHEVLGEVCGCGWDTSHLPESQHTDIHRYTSGTVVRWVRGECYVLLASTSSADSTTTSPEQPQDQDEHQHQQIDPSDGAPEEEEYQVTTPGEVVSPEEGTAVSGGDEDPHCCSEEAECCLASPSPQGEEPGSLEPLQQDSKGVIGVWPGCQVHSCFTNKRDEMDGGQKQHAACRVHCGQGETMKGQTIKDESQEKMEDEEVDEEEEEEEEEKEEQEQMDLGSEEEEDKKEQEQVEVSCEEEEEEEEKKEVSEQSSWSSQNDAFDMDVDMREHAANEVEEQSNNEDETDDTTSRDLQITREKEIEERPVSECSEGKEEEDEGKENDEETCTNSKDEWRGIEGVEGVEHDRSTSPLETCGVPSLVTALPCEDVEAAVVSEESLDGDSSCTLIIHEEEDTSCREDTREEDTGEDISKGSKEDLQETVLKDAMQIKENETTVQDSFREMIREDNKEIISDDSSRKDGTERNWRENKALGSCKNTFGSLREDTTLEAWSKDTTEESDKNTQEDTGKEGTAVDSCKNTQEDSWKGDNTIDSYKNTQEDTTVDSCKNTQEDSWKEDTTIDSYKNPQEHSWRENITTDGFKNTQEEKWKEDGTVETLTCNPLQNAQEVTSSNSNSSNSQPILPPHSLSLAPKEKCASSDLFGLQNPASQPSFPHTAPPIHTHYDEEEEEEDDEDDDDDVEEESDDDSSSVTSSSSTSSSSSSSSSSSDDDDRINFKQRGELLCVVEI
ncbi:hypothetical protein GWK47_025341 [Chionoecetes opilio]|uniref:Uncharacterized protein n=1 Tax=Chionoecetes opilio TaxID=41210 RepID=A0A8J8WG42_CHIOP|nr:hypothetical protein GWK47_025341 [Chionoecetes opilio]